MIAKIYQIISLVTIITLSGSLAKQAEAATYFVGPSGSNSNDGLSYGMPFGTFEMAIGLANPGDTIYALGGTYNLSSKLLITKSGSSGNRINLWAVPGETPVLNFSAQTEAAANRGVELSGSGDWWHFKGLTVQNAGDNGVLVQGDSNVFEQIVTRYNHDSGFQLHGSASNNLILNSDSYENFDTLAGGENADGFAAKFEDLGPGNIFRGNRAWGNSDDGWDTWNSSNGVLIQDSWSFDNGFNTWAVPVFNGDGSGYKLGQLGGDHVLTNVLAVDNAGNGVDINANGTGVKVYNSTSFSNNKRNWQFDETSAETQNLHVLQNNISFAGAEADVFLSGVDSSSNTWNGGPFAVNSDDFVSTNRFDGLTDLLKLPRQSDGSLPDLNGFLYLVEGSNLIDAGAPISFLFGGVAYNLPYNAAAPDLGAFETKSVVPEPGSFGMMLVAAGLLVGRWRRRGL